MDPTPSLKGNMMADVYDQDLDAMRQGAVRAFPEYIEEWLNGSRQPTSVGSDGASIIEGDEIEDLLGLAFNW